MANRNPTPEDHAGVAVQIERRAAIRHSCDLDSSCEPLRAERGVLWPATVVDISTLGVGLRLNRRFEAGSILTVELQSADGKMTRKLLVRVVRVIADSAGAWRIGCTLVRPLRDDELQALL